MKNKNLITKSIFNHSLLKIASSCWSSLRSSCVWRSCRSIRSFSSVNCWTSCSNAFNFACQSLTVWFAALSICWRSSNSRVKSRTCVCNRRLVRKASSFNRLASSSCWYAIWRSFSSFLRCWRICCFDFCSSWNSVSYSFNRLLNARVRSSISPLNSSVSFSICCFNAPIFTSRRKRASSDVCNSSSSSIICCFWSSAIDSKTN